MTVRRDLHKLLEFSQMNLGRKRDKTQIKIRRDLIDRFAKDEVQKEEAKKVELKDLQKPLIPTVSVLDNG